MSYDNDDFTSDSVDDLYDIDPWSKAGRTAALAPVRAFFESIPIEQHSDWNFTTIGESRYWFPYGGLPDNAARNFLRWLSRQWDKPETADLPALFFADLIVKPNPFEKDSTVPGVLVHGHGLSKINAADERRKQRVRDSFEDHARGTVDIQFDSFRDRDGGLFGLIDRQYFKKDWRNPMKPDPWNPRRRLPCNDRFTSYMRNYVAATDLRPADLVLCKGGFKRYGRVLRLIQRPIQDR